MFPAYVGASPKEKSPTINTIRLLIVTLPSHNDVSQPKIQTTMIDDTNSSYNCMISYYSAGIGLYAFSSCSKLCSCC
jgi:hypothetical protein